MRTNQLIKIKQGMTVNRSNLKNYILMEVGDLIEAEAVGGKGPEVPMLVSPEDEERDNMMDRENSVVMVMKSKRKITKFQIKN